MAVDGFLGCMVAIADVFETDYNRDIHANKFANKLPGVCVFFHAVLAWAVPVLTGCL